MSAIPIHVSEVHVVGSEDRARRDLELARAGFLARYRMRTTREAYALALRQWFEFCAQHFLEPLKAERSHVELWARKLEEFDGLSLSTVANKLNALSGFYRLAHADGYIDKDPMTHVRRPQIDRESPREGLTRTELHDLLEAAESNAQDLALVCLLGLNGLRVAEALQIDIDRLDRYKGHTVVTVKRKGGKWQPIPFASRTAWAVERLAAGRTEGPLFRSRTGSRLDSHGAGRIVRRLVKQCGIHKHITPHSLRHTFVTLARDAGVSDGDIIASTGHADGRMIEYYDRHRAKIERNATHSVAAYVERAT